MDMLFTTAMAEEATELSQVLEGATKEQALTAGAILGASMGVIIALGIVYFVLCVIADWKIFTKAGRAGWKSIIPILSDYEEYDLCWQGSIGVAYAVCVIALQYLSYNSGNPASWQNIVYCVLGIVALVLNFMQSMRLSSAFGKGKGFGFGLFLLGPIFRLILGFGSAKYVGHPDR